MYSSLILIVVINFLLIRDTTQEVITTIITKSEQKFFVVIRYKLMSGTCGGAIITPHFVLTTDGCVQYNKELYTLHFGGDFHLNSVIRKIEKVHAYSVKEPNGLSLVEVHEEIPFGTNISVIGFQTDLITAREKWTATVSGYITDSFDATMSKSLVQFDIPTSPYRDIACTSALDAASSPPRERHFCTDVADFATLQCLGEEGDPLLYLNLLTGIASKQFGCDNPHDISIFYNVAYYATWIERITRQVRSANMEDVACKTIDERHYDWFNNTMIGQLILCKEPDCNRAFESPELICIPTPISPILFVTTRLCIQLLDGLFDDAKRYQPQDNLKIMYKSQLYTILNVITGRKLLPFFAQTELDIAIVEIVDGLDEFVTKEVPIFPVYSALEKRLPLTAVLFKYISKPTSQMVGIPVEIKTAADCAPLTNGLYNFKVSLELFCVSPFCGKSGDLYHTCSASGGAPIFTAIGDLIGVAVYQEKCERKQPTIGVRISKFVGALREEVVKMMNQKSRGSHIPYNVNF